MCSTAYGGSSQLTDLLNERSNLLNKYTFSIQGDADMIISISDTLSEMAKSPEKLLPTTVLFVEIPTNPDMKVPDIDKLAKVLLEYKEKTQKDVLLLVDTTFAPNSQVLARIKATDAELPAMVFISLSKSISGGFTTGGTLISNHTPLSQEILKEVRATSLALDTGSKCDQLHVLVKHHIGVEERLNASYQLAVEAASSLGQAVEKYASYKMPIKLVPQTQADAGYPSSTFSFNLPGLQDESTNEALAQRYVDLLCEHTEHFKPCVSFGQDNTLVYATVPATSTQGAIKAEDKAKQAVGGVQLVRLSFPPRGDISTICQILSQAVSKIYAGAM